MKQLFLNELKKFFGSDKYYHYWRDNIRVELKYRYKVEELARLYNVKLINCCVFNNAILESPETFIFSCDLIFD